MDLVAGNLRRLSVNPQEALKRFASLGNVAEIATLTLVHGETEEDARIDPLQVFSSRTLDAVRRESEKSLDFVRKARFHHVAAAIVSRQRYIATMQGRTAAFSTFSDAQFDEAAFVKDKGSGISGASRKKREGFGLSNMRTRASQIDGKLDIDTAAGHGTSIVLTVPIPS